MNNSARENMFLIVVTADVSHESISWSKDDASRNMLLISVTPDVFHEPISWMKTMMPR